MAEAALRPAPLPLRAAAALVRRLPLGRFRTLHALPRGHAPFEARLPPSAGGYRYSCDLRDLIAREVFYTGRYAPQEDAVVRAALAPGDSFVDVGANWGFFTLLAAHLVGPAGRVLAVEADPRVFRLLSANLARNQLPWVQAVEAAAADRAGTLRLTGHQAAGGNWGTSTLLGEGGEGSFAVRAAPLDALLDAHRVERVSLAKIDVEGAEAMVLQGMAGGLAEGRYRRVLLELHPFLHPAGTPLLAEVADTLQAHGYRGWWVDQSPAVTRRAAYARRVDARALLHPLGDPQRPLDPWPHQLWCAPGEGEL